MKTQRGYTIIELAMLAIWVVVPIGLGGWVWNVVKIIHTCCAVIDGMLVMRIVGIFIAPLGAILGFF